MYGNANMGILVPNWFGVLPVQQQGVARYVERLTTHKPRLLAAALFDLFPSSHAHTHPLQA